MKPSASVDTSELHKALRQITLFEDDLIYIEGAGAAILVNGMRGRVPVDTSATQNSIRSGHFVELSDTRVVDDIGPETDYAPVIEYGRDDMPNYPIQPFVRPTAIDDFSKVIRAIGFALGEIVLLRWPKS